MLPIVDIHCHYLAGQEGAIDGFRRLAESPEVHRVAVCALDLKLPYSADFPFMSVFSTTNEQLEEMIRQVDSPKLVPFCYIDPREKDAPRQVEHWVRQRGMRGVKMYPPQGWYPNDPRCVEVCRAIQECGVPVLLHMGRVSAHPALRSEYARPIYLEEIGLACPKLKLIVGHFAGPWYLEAIHIAMSFPEWTFDLTSSGHWYLDSIKTVCRLPWDPGLRRIVLGTDGSGANNLDLVRETRRWLEPGGFTEEQFDQMFHHNGLRVLGES
jgi:predicted TIM-barrel fold metal-dependent hydrolase